MSCADPYSASRAVRISEMLASHESPVVVVGDSHVERLACAFNDGERLVDGHPIVYAGIAGATFSVLRDCIPWSAIGATTPYRIIVMGGVNDALLGVGYTATGDVTSVAYQPMLDVLTIGRGICGDVVIATDPPPELEAGIDSYRVHQTARVLYYISINAVGAVGPLTFRDVYGALGSGGSPASLPYSGGRYSTVHSTLDGIHYAKNGCVSILEAIL